ncbi:hypothetical protein [Halonatronomonas betaini]|nr:hypothetical protein [Halonatronomonas betaini]
MSKLSIEQVDSQDRASQLTEHEKEVMEEKLRRSFRKTTRVFS